jgi:hypothetical protein
MDNGQKNPMDNLILIPTFKIYVFSYSRRTDGLTDGQTEKFIQCGLGNHTRCMWAGGTFLCCLRKVPRTHSCSAYVLQELGWKYTKKISFFVQIFLLNPNFCLAHRNRYSEVMDDGQKTPRGHPDFNSYVKILRVFIFQTDGWTDRRTEKLIRCGLGTLSVPPGQ